MNESVRETFNDLFMTFISAALGYISGIILFRHQQKEEIKNKIDTAINSLLFELSLHKQITDKYLEEFEKSDSKALWTYYTSAYSSLISLGLFTYFSYTTQYKIEEHYRLCNNVNELGNLMTFVKRDESYLQGWYRSDLVRDVKKINESIDVVVGLIESERRVEASKKEYILILMLTSLLIYMVYQTFVIQNIVNSLLMFILISSIILIVLIYQNREVILTRFQKNALAGRS